MKRLCSALTPVLGPRISVSTHGAKGIVVQFDGGSGGSMVARAAPWLPGLSERRDFLRTAGNVAHAVQEGVPEEWAEVTGLGAVRPRVTAAGDVLTIRFYGGTGEPLLPVEVSMSGHAQ